METDKYLSESLRLIRVFNDLSQKDLAEKLEVSRSYLSEIEKGHKIPNMNLIKKYGEVFDIKPSAILFFSEKLGSNKDGEYKSFALQKLLLKTMKFFEEFNDKAV
ncbi:MAG: helix-turn-helix transcriptional regulator [Oligoflexia bacterium]|nr:helix-turn-helix transcriptional regulator [Oligoflexia bacterium]